jgi:hypothetical protein
VSGDARDPRGWADRFPGLDVLDQVRHWDPVTADAVLARIAPPVAVKFFTESEESCARALLNLLTGQDGQDSEVAVPVLEMVDARLAAGETDGWRYADMPEDAAQTDQVKVIQAVQDLGSADWHRLPAGHVWSLWTRYACTAFYAHPFAWAEIGFPGPAYPRGYKNIGVGKLEPFEVRDVRPAEDPVREAG